MRNLFKLILLILSLIPLYFGLSGALGGALSLNGGEAVSANLENQFCLLYTSPSPRDQRGSRMPSSA